MAREVTCLARLANVCAYGHTNTVWHRLTKIVPWTRSDRFHQALQTRPTPTRRGRGNQYTKRLRAERSVSLARDFHRTGSVKRRLVSALAVSKKCSWTKRGVKFCTHKHPLTRSVVHVCRLLGCAACFRSDLHVERFQSTSSNVLHLCGVHQNN